MFPIPYSKLKIAISNDLKTISVEYETNKKLN